MKLKDLLFTYAFTSLSFTCYGSVMTSFSVIHLITKEIAANDVEVIPLFKGQEDSHHFDLTPKTLIQMEQQDWIIVNGIGFEHWLSQLSNNNKISEKLLIASTGVTPKANGPKTFDPHAWLDLDNLELYFKTIAKALTTRHQTKSHEIEARAQKATAKLIALKQEQQKVFSTLPTDWCLVTAHNSFSYLARAYGFQAIALMGDHDGEQLPPKQFIKYLEQVKKCKHRVFFGDGSVQDSAIIEWARKTQSTFAGVLWSDNIPNYQSETIWSYLEHNLNTIKKAFIPQAAR